MKKEIIIISAILVFILILNAISQAYTNETVEVISGQLEELEEKFDKNEDDIDIQYMEEKVEEIKSNWDERYNILACYIEHEELEKVYTNIVALDGLLNLEEYGNAIAELEKAKYTLKHIKEKYTFSVLNIF